MNILAGLSFQEVPLNDDGDNSNDDVESECVDASLDNNSDNNNSKPKNGSRVRFDSVVKSTTIPSHRDYSMRAKRLIWSDPKDMIRSIERNAREFAFELRSAGGVVLEEDQMYLDIRSKEYVHPVHVPSSLQLSSSSVSAAPRAVAGCGSDYLRRIAWDRMRRRLDNFL